MAGTGWCGLLVLYEFPNRYPLHRYPNTLVHTVLVHYYHNDYASLTLGHSTFNLNPHDMIVPIFTGKITTLFLAPPLCVSPERSTKDTPI